MANRREPRTPRRRVLAQTDAAGAKALAESLVTKITQATLHGYEPTEEEDIYECWFRAALHASAVCHVIKGFHVGERVLISGSTAFYMEGMVHLPAAH